MTADRVPPRDRCGATIQVRHTVRACDLRAGHDGHHETNDSQARPEYHWANR